MQILIAFYPRLGYAVLARTDCVAVLSDERVYFRLRSALCLAPFNFTFPWQRPPVLGSQPTRKTIYVPNRFHRLNSSMSLQFSDMQFCENHMAVTDNPGAPGYLGSCMPVSLHMSIKHKLDSKICVIFWGSHGGYWQPGSSWFSWLMYASILTHVDKT